MDNLHDVGLFARFDCNQQTFTLSVCLSNRMVAVVKSSWSMQDSVHSMMLFFLVDHDSNEAWLFDNQVNDLSHAM